MYPDLEAHRDAIDALCRRYGVRRLEVFGSSADAQRFDAVRSDIDLLVEFDPQPEESYADRYFGLLEDLSALLRRPVDLVVERVIRNPYFLESLRTSRQILFPARSA